MKRSEICSMGIFGYVCTKINSSCDFYNGVFFMVELSEEEWLMMLSIPLLSSHYFSMLSILATTSPYNNLVSR